MSTPERPAIDNTPLVAITLSPAPVELFAPIVGYLVVAIACLLAGFTVATAPASPVELWNRISTNTPFHRAFIGFVVLILPIYMNMAVLYEQSTLKSCMEAREGGEKFREFLWRTSKQLPLLYLFSLLLTITAVSLIHGQDPRLFFPPVILVALAPNVLVAVVRTRLWPQRRSAFVFLIRHFFPALATCLLPFVLGASLAVSEDHPRFLLTLFLTSAVFVIYFRIALKRSLWFVVVTGTVVLSAIIVLTILITLIPAWTALRDHVMIVAFGVFMSLVMGISESWKATTLARDPTQNYFLPRDEYLDTSGQPEDFLEAGTNLAAAIFPAVFLLTVLHPAINTNYLFVAPLFLAIQYGLWIRYARIWKASSWTNIRVAFGLAIPLLISVGVTFGQPPTWTLDTPVGYAVVSIIALVYAFSSKYWDLYETHVQTKPGLLAFQNTVSCLIVTGIATTVLGTITGIIYVVGVWFKTLTKPTETKLNVLATVYFLAALILIWVIRMRLGSTKKVAESSTGEPGNPSHPNGSEPPATPTQMRLGALIHCCYPTTSSIAGLLVFSYLLNHGSLSFPMCFLASLPIVLVTMAGFLANDIYDRAKDLTSVQPKPIARGLVPVWRARVALVLLLMGSQGIAFLTCNGETALLLSGIGAGVLLYSPVAAFFPSAKGFITAILASSPLAYAGVASSAPAPLATYFVLLSFIIGRELLLDSRDLAQDSLAGLRTLPTLFGRTLSLRLGWTIMIVTGIFSLPMAHSVGSGLIRICALVVLLHCMILSKTHLNEALLRSKLVVLLGAIGLTC